MPTSLHKTGEAMLEAARQARHVQTPAEQKLWDVVRGHRLAGLHFRRQAIVGPFRLDFYCAAHRLAVEVDGGVHQKPDVAKRDAERQIILEREFGVRFVRVSNADVDERPNRVRERILHAVAEG